MELSLWNFRLEPFAWELSVCLVRFGWKSSLGNFGLASLTGVFQLMKCRLGIVAWKLPLRVSLSEAVTQDFGLEIVASDVSLGDFSLGNFRFGSFAWGLPLRMSRLATFARELLLRASRL